MDEELICIITRFLKKCVPYAIRLLLSQNLCISSWHTVVSSQGHVVGFFLIHRDHIFVSKRQTLGCMEIVVFKSENIVMHDVGTEVLTNSRPKRGHEKADPLVCASARVAT
jgi:hypothetical protein